MRHFGAAVVLLVSAGLARAAVKAEPVEYEYQGAKLKGVFYYDDAVT